METDYEKIGYSYHFRENGKKLIFRKITSEKERLQAEIEASDNSGVNVDLKPYISHISVSSPQSRFQLIKALNNRFEATDWTNLIETACSTIYQEERTESEVVNLKTYNRPPKINYLEDPLILEGIPNIIYGEGGSCKSLLALYLSGLISVLHDLPVLYLDWETEEEEMRRRMWQLFGAQQPERVFYKRCYFPLNQSAEKIKEVVDKEQIKMVIVDSLGGALGGELIEASGAITFFNSLRSLKATSLIISHVAKSNSQTPYGSVYFYNLGRNIWEVKKREIENEVRVALYHKKSNFTSLASPVGYSIKFEQENIFVSRQDLIIKEMSEEIPDLEKIMSILKSSSIPLSFKEVASRAGRPMETIRIRLSELKRKGVIERDFEGKYYLEEKLL